VTSHDRTANAAFVTHPSSPICDQMEIPTLRQMSTEVRMMSAK